MILPLLVARCLVVNEVPSSQIVTITHDWSKVKYLADLLRIIETAAAAEADSESDTVQAPGAPAVGNDEEDDVREENEIDVDEPSAGFFDRTTLPPWIFGSKIEGTPATFDFLVKGKRDLRNLLPETRNYLDLVVNGPRGNRDPSGYPFPDHMRVGFSGLLS